MAAAMRLLTSIDSVKEIPGSLREVSRIEPSSSYGMNSVPMNLSEAIAAATRMRAKQMKTGRCCMAYFSDLT
jgi:hypothetical protein